MTLRTTCVLFALGLSSQSAAVEVTDMPDGLRGDATITYSGHFGRHSLAQDGQKVGKRRITNHEMTVHMEMAPTDGISIYVAVPTTLSHVIKYPEAYEMLVDPATGQGQYILDQPISAPEYAGSGGGGVWFGMGFAPYAERYKKAHQLTWRLDLAARTKTKRTFWEEEGGKRGATLGGNAYKLSGAFSADNGSSRPFMSAAWTLETRRGVLVGDGDGRTEVQVKPGSTFFLHTGLEVLLTQQDSSKIEPYFEVSMGFGYRSWREVPSGIFLPNVPNTTETISITQTDAILGRAGLHLGVRALPYVQWRIGLEARYETPYFIEDLYTVKTGGNSFDLVFATALSIGYR